MIDMEQAYRDLVSLEVKGQAPDGTRERLAADPTRWRGALQAIRLELAAQTTQREAAILEIQSECMGLPNGRKEYIAHKSEYMRWKAGMKRFRASLETRLSEVSQLARQDKIDNWQVKEVEEWKRDTRQLVAAVETLLALADDQSIPSDLWDALEAAYDALPEWMLPDERHYAHELAAAAD